MTPTARLATWHGLMYGASQASAAPTDKSGQQEVKQANEVKPVAAADAESDDDGDGYDMSLFD